MPPTYPSRIDLIRARDAHLIQIVDAALTDAARRAGEHLVCRPGCTQCCHGTFAINTLDAERLRSAMANLAAMNPKECAKIQFRAQEFLREYGATFPGDRHTGILDTTPEAEEAFDEYANEAPCPVLNPESGFCDLYEARPIACRVFGPPVRMSKESTEETVDEDAPVFAVCELCFNEASTEEIEASEMFVPREEEENLLRDFDSELTPNSETPPGETIVAFCLLPANLLSASPVNTPIAS